MYHSNKFRISSTLFKRYIYTPPVEAYIKCPAAENGPSETKLQMSRLCLCVSYGIFITQYCCEALIYNAFTSALKSFLLSIIIVPCMSRIEKRTPLLQMKKPLRDILFCPANQRFQR